MEGDADWEDWLIKHCQWTIEASQCVSDWSSTHRIK